MPSLLTIIYYGTAQRAKNAMNKLAEEYKILKGNYSSPKPVRQSKVMSYLGITGMFFPYTFEANVNVHIPPYQIPAVMLHELVHLRGFMREDEANFISYLAGTKSGYDDFYYSTTMLALLFHECPSTQRIMSFCRSLSFVFGGCAKGYGIFAGLLEGL